MVQCIEFSQEFCRVEGLEFVLLPFVPDDVPVRSCDDAQLCDYLLSHGISCAMWSC
jgi:hypothetical protein